MNESIEIFSTNHKSKIKQYHILFLIHSRGGDERSERNESEYSGLTWHSTSSGDFNSACFADLTGYVAAPYPSSYSFAPNYPWQFFEVGVGHRCVLRPTVENVGTFDLSAAKLRIVIAKVWIWDGSVWTGPFTDAATVEANVEVLNGEMIEPKTYTVDLGTLKVGKAKNALLNVWYADGVYFIFGASVWYLP